MGLRKIWNMNTLLAITALFVSVMTLIIFIRQTNIMDQQSRHSVMPYLILEWNSNEADTLITIQIENHGVGPAVISKRTFYYQGETHDMEFRDFLSESIPEMEDVRVLSSASLEPGFSIAAGEHREIITVGGDLKSYRTFSEIMENLTENSDFNYDIRYESIYEDSWLLQGGRLKPIPLTDN